MNDGESLRLVDVAKQDVVGRSLTPRKRLDNSPVKQMTWRQLPLQLGVDVLRHNGVWIKPTLRQRRTI